MRWLVVLLFLPLSSAVTTTVLTDATADTSLGSHGDNIERWRSADLIRLDLDEGAVDLRFDLIVAQGEDATKWYFDEVAYSIHLRHGMAAYRIDLNEWNGVGATSDIEAWLNIVHGPGDRGHRIAYLDGQVTPEGAYRVTVPRAMLLDENDVELFRGESLRDVFVTSWMSADFFETGTLPSDRMPDAATGQAPIQLGVEQSGLARLAAEGRIRGSNGEATTYLWRVNLTNLAAYDDTFTLALAKPPLGWEVRLPYASVNVPANETITFPILATVPFKHQHGAIDSFLIEARSKTDLESVARIDLGVEYLEPAQPAGHHNTVFIHGRPDPLVRISIGLGGADVGGYRPYLSTRVSEDPIEIDAGASECVGLRNRFGWVAELEPRLRLGLDADMGALGTLGLDVVTGLPLEGARLDGRIMVVDHYGASRDAREYDSGAGSLTLATITSTGTTSLPTNGRATLSAEVHPSDEGDFVEYVEGQSMVMVLWLSGEGSPACIIGSDSPRLVAGGSLQLPLVDYHDPIDASFAAPDFIQLTSLGPVERLVPAGGSALWNLSLSNDSPEERRFEVFLSGSNQEWASLPAGGHFTAPANGSVDIPVALAPPSSARQGEHADVIVEVVNVDDPRMRGLLRIVGTVAGHGEIVQDDSQAVEAIIEESRDSPQPGALILVLLAGLAARLRRSGHKR